MLTELDETRQKVNAASEVLGLHGFRVDESLDLALTLLVELDEQHALPAQPIAAEDSWNRFRSIMQSVRVAILAATEEDKVSPKIAQQLADAQEQLEQTLYDFLTTYRHDVSVEMRSTPTGDHALRAIDRTIEQVAARQLVAEARGARDEVRRVLDDTQRAAGKVGETVLAGHFADFARRERRAADLLRALCAGALIGITALAAVFLFGGTGDDLTTSEELARLSVGLPIAALAAYLGRESTRHRATSRWAHALELQLRTLDAYCEPLTEDVRLQLRADFGRRVFLTDGIAQTGDDEAGPSTAGDVTGLLQEALALLRTPGRP